MRFATPHRNKQSSWANAHIDARRLVAEIHTANERSFERVGFTTDPLSEVEI